MNRLVKSRELWLALAILAVVVLVTARFPRFAQPGNLLTIFNDTSILMMLALGQMAVILTRSIDLSMASNLALTGMLVALTNAAFPAIPVPLLIAGCILVGTALGAFNGFVTAKLKVPPIIATLGSMYIFSAIMFIVIGGAWISGLPGTLSPLVNGWVGIVPASALVIAVVYLIAWIILRKLPFGNHIYAIGCNEQSARLVGINVDRTKIMTYALLGFLAGVAALLYVARLRNVEINIGTTIALEAIAATILGGTNIRGGVGSLLGTLLGVAFIRIMQNGLVLTGVSSLWETVIIGSLLIVVLTADALRNRNNPRAL